MPTPPTDLVVLVDADGRRTGTAPKASVHTTDTPLHLAFSVYVFDGAGRFLVTRRAVSKITWPGVWTNSCCGHVRPDETPADAARRRLGEELGLVALDLHELLPDFGYRAVSAEGIVEHEVCPVFLARVEGDPVADPDEIAEWRWSSWASFRVVAESAPWALSPWSVLQTAQLPTVLPEPVTPSRSARAHTGRTEGVFAHRSAVRRSWLTPSKRDDPESGWPRAGQVPPRCQSPRTRCPRLPSPSWPGC